MLEEKENVLQKKISIEVERAKEFTKANNRQGIYFFLLGIFWTFSMERWTLARVAFVSLR